MLAEVSVEKLQKKIACSCDPEGKITSLEDGDNAITFSMLDLHGVSLLGWEGKSDGEYLDTQNPYSSYALKQPSLKQVLSWAVMSRTSELVAEKLGFGYRVSV